MLKRLKTHHLFRRVPLISLSTKHQTLWKNPQRRRGGGAQAIGSGDNRRRQIAFLIRSFINPRTHVEGIICNITTSSRFLLALSGITIHLSLYSTQEREKKKKKSYTKSNLPDLTGRCHFFYPHSFLLIPSHVIKQGLTNQFTFSQDNKKSQFQKDGDIFHKLYTHTKSPTLLLLSLFSLVFPPFSPLHLGDIFKQAISSTQCVGYGI